MISKKTSRDGQKSCMKHQESSFIRKKCVRNGPLKDTLEDRKKKFEKINLPKKT